MKPIDLMIGDYIMFNKNTYIIEEISKKGWAHLIDNDGSECHVELSSDYILDAITPIPLTAEILEKNGFVKQWNNNWQFNDYHSIIISEDFYIAIFELSTRLDYVHELQHALRLAGIEKEIKL